MSSPTTPQTVAVDVETTAQVHDLAGEIMRRRTKPLVLVTTTSDGAFHFDVGMLRRELAGIADVVTIRSGRATYDLEQLLPPRAHAFGGASRCYPPDFGLNPAVEQSPLRFTFGSTTDDLIADAMAQAGSRTVESTPRPALVRAIGEVKGFLAGGTRALIVLENGDTATASPDVLGHGIRLDEALRHGDNITGTLSPDGKVLTPSLHVPTSDYFPEGSHTLALVTKTTDARVTLQLHPDINVTLRRRDITDDPDVPIGDLHTVGDVVRVRVLINDEGRHTVTLMGVDPEAPLHPSLPLIQGASPWLREGESHAAVAAPAVEDAPVQDAAPTPVPVLATTDTATTSDVAALRHEVTELRRDILALTNLVARLGGSTAPASVDDEFAKLRAHAADLEEQLRIERVERADAEAKLTHEVELRRDAVRGARGDGGPVERMPIITTETALREAIQGLWEERAHGSDRKEWPLRDYRVGPDFIDSLCKISESARAKTLRAAVDAITGRDKEVPGRDLHRLRRGNGGDDSFVTRADGAHAWRSAVENNTASARRLHYWALPGGGIELSRVVLHDDVTP